jgi:hypothetical protein
MHIDEMPLLEYIHSRLGKGTVYAYKNKCSLRILAQKEIASFIKIFEREKLNTTKRLDFYNFQKAFLLYTASKQKSTIKQEILTLKNGMNKNRPYETLPFTDIEITDY